MLSSTCADDQMMARVPDHSGGALPRQCAVAPEELYFMSASTIPQLYRFTSVRLWVEAYVNSEIERLRPESSHRIVSLPSGEAVYLCGSIGFDSALAPDGQVWINEYQQGEEDTDQWRVTNRTEHLSMLAIAQRRTRPELIILLPLRPASSIECSSCNGSGYAVGNVVVCRTCGSMGWLPGA
jgi:hypothetical protein